MENHGTDMSTDSASLRRTSRELSDQLPTIPRRNSNEDRDTSKPRKRLAGMGSRPQSPMAVDESDHHDVDPKEPTPSTELASNLSQHTLQDDGSGSTTTSTVPVKRSPSGTRITIRVPVGSRDDKPDDEPPSASTSQDDREEDKGIHSSALYSDESNYARSPELVQQIHEVDESDDQELAAIGVVEEETVPPLSNPQQTKEIFEHVLRELQKRENPGPLLVQLHGYIGEWIKNTEDFSKFKNEYQKDSGVWDLLPKVLEHYLRRQESFSADFFRKQDDKKSGPEITMEFFTRYAQLVARLMAIDLQSLIDCEDSIPHLYTSSYYNNITLILRLDTPLIQAFRRGIEHDFAKERLDIGTSFAVTHGGLKVANDILGVIFNKVKKIPQLFQTSIYYLDMACNLLNLCIRLGKTAERNGIESELIVMTTRAVSDAKEIYTSYDLNLKRLIETLTPATNLKDLMYASDLLSHMIGEIVSLDYEQLMKTFDKQIGGRYEDMLPNEIADFAKWSCLYPLLLKMMTANRLEVRLHGVQRMSEVILNGWQNHNRNASCAYLRYIGDVLEEKKIIEYICGPDAHPEMTRRSNNILSFLLVIERFTPALREVVWQPLLEGKDTRTAHMVIELIGESLQHASYQLCIDYCERATNIPPSAFNVRIIQLTTRLIEATRQTYLQLDHSEKPPYIDEPPFRLLATALKALCIAEEDSQAAKSWTSSAIPLLQKNLGNLMQHGPDQEIQYKIMTECVEDVRNLRPCTTGSMCVFKGFLEHAVQAHGTESVAEYLKEQNFLEVFVKEVSNFVETNRKRDSNYLDQHLDARLNLLLLLLWYYPELIDEKLSKELWDDLIGDNVIGPRERDSALNLLKPLVDNRSSSPIIERFAFEYFPNLNVSYITLPALAFLKTAVIQLNSLIEVKDGLLQVKGMDQIWRVVLTSPIPQVSKDAINFLVTFYLDVIHNIEVSGETTMEPHFQLLENCIDNLKTYAPSLDESGRESPSAMSIDGNEEDQLRVLKFDRSVDALKTLILVYKQRPQFAVGRRGSGNAANRGEVMRFNMQLYADGKNKPPQLVELYANDPVEYLHDRISRLLGSQNYRLIHNGREIKIRDEPQKLLREFNFREVNSLLCSSRGIQGPEDQPSSETVVTPLETKVLEHFDELYALLGIEEPHGRLMYEILTRLPPHEKVMSHLAKDEVSEDIFPRGHPWQVLYYIYALRIRLHPSYDPEFTEEKKNRFMGSAARLLLKGLLLDDISGKTALSSRIRANLTKDYLQLIKNVMSALGPEVVQKATEGFLGYISTLLSMIQNATTLPGLAPQTSAEIINLSLWIVFHCMTMNDTNWDEFTGSENIEELLLKLFIEDGRQDVRWQTANTIVTFTNSQIRGLNVEQKPEKKYLLYFWDVLSRNIWIGSQHPSQVSEFYEACKIFFSLVNEAEPDKIDKRSRFEEWSSLVIRYSHRDPITEPGEDFFLVGISKLLSDCFEAIDDDKDTIDCKELTTTVFERFLFTPFSGDDGGDEDDFLEERFPVLDRQTRVELYNLIIVIIKYIGGGKISSMLLDLFPGDGEALRDGWALDKNRWIISPAGFVGLKNLSNTCYLNSLITQLFMNTEFRDFMLAFPINDDDKQNLIFALKLLFAQMQAGTQKAGDTSALASSIRDHENNEIDVSVQMDVDEFFNLLFDRIEGQITDSERKNAFKAIYGGQLVQQVKSKECPHVSEREEPFSAIQCEIKGRHNLVESMQAYIEGEIMEGDNKYKCSKCDKHVDAVKRSCLKSIPDNLIFHLKRFDFDLETMLRRKINDQFEFPEVIDMKPYMVDYSETNAEPDFFELCGVLVHTGTAESGHYYSYIKNSENPRNANGTQNWLQFNDSEVSVFDYNGLPEASYGGNFNGDMGHTINPRPYSAYMLFYKRKNGEKDEVKTRDKDTLIPAEIREDILNENERVIRDYCMFDDEFVNFVYQVAAITHSKDESERHTRGSNATVLALTTMQQIVARMKEYPGSDSLFRFIIQTTSSCLHCAQAVLNCAVDNDGLLRIMLLRCPNQRTRQNFAAIILNGLAKLRSIPEGRKMLYGVEDLPNSDVIEDIVTQPSIARALISSLCKMMKNLLHLMRPWDDFFDLLTKIAFIGPAEIALLLNECALENALELFYHDFPARTGQNVFRALDNRPRRPSMVKLLEFIRYMQQFVTPMANDASQEDEEIFRLPEDGKYAATYEERSGLFDMMTPKDSRPIFKFLSRQLDMNIDVEQTKQIIHWWITQYDAVNTRVRIHDTLLSGINSDPADKAGPFLECLVLYIELSNKASEVCDLIRTVAEEVPTIHNSGGREHLQFFRSLTEIQTEATGETLTLRSVLEFSGFWAPPLLIYWETEVRYDAYQFMEEILFKHRVEEYTWEAPFYEKVAENLVKEIFAFIEKKFFASKELVQGADSKTFDIAVRVLEMCKDPTADVEHARRIQDIKNTLNSYLEEEMDFGSDEWNVSDFGSDEQLVVDDEST